MKVRGTVRRLTMGTGGWLIEAEDGRRYQLKDAPPELCRDGVLAEIEGKLAKSLMSFGMAGPILEVKKYRRV